MPAPTPALFPAPIGFHLNPSHFQLSPSHHDLAVVFNARELLCSSALLARGSGVAILLLCVANSAESPAAGAAHSRREGRCFTYFKSVNV